MDSMGFNAILESELAIKDIRANDPSYFQQAPNLFSDLLLPEFLIPIVKMEDEDEELVAYSSPGSVSSLYSSPESTPNTSPCSSPCTSPVSLRNNKEEQLDEVKLKKKLKNNKKKSVSLTGVIACANCHKNHIKCDGRSPCSSCRRKGITCQPNLPQKRGPKPGMIHKMKLKLAEQAETISKLSMDLKKQKEATVDSENKFLQLKEELELLKRNLNNGQVTGKKRDRDSDRPEMSGPQPSLWPDFHDDTFLSFLVDEAPLSNLFIQAQQPIC